MNWHLFLSTYVLIFVAELPDKTAFATLLMAARGRPWPIFLGVALAFVIQSIVAVSFGGLIGQLPERWVHWGAACIFFIFAALEWKKSNAPEESVEAGVGNENSQTFWTSALRSFMVIFVAEWGDLTQLATATLAAKTKDLWTIFFSATLALWSVTVVAIFVGRYAQKFMQPKLLQRIAAVAFASVGLYFIKSSIF